MKKIILLIITFVSLFIIYKCFDKNKVNYVCVSDYYINNKINYNDYIYKYLVNSDRLGTFNINFTNKDTYSIYKDILNNRTIRINNKDFYFKKVLRESDVVIINVGMGELSSFYNKYNMNENNNFFNKLYFDIEKLIKEVKKYAKETIIFIGLYNPTNYYDAKTDEFFYNIDTKLNKLMMNNDINYIDLYELIKNSNNKENISFKIASILEFYI